VLWPSPSGEGSFFYLYRPPNANALPSRLAKSDTPDAMLLPVLLSAFIFWSSVVGLTLCCCGLPADVQSYFIDLGVGCFGIDWDLRGELPLYCCILSWFMRMFIRSRGERVLLN